MRFGSTTERVAAYSYDFQVAVHHPACAEASDCLLNVNEETVSNHALGLRCDVRVKRDDQSCSESDYTDNLPCLKWNDFFPKALALTELDGTHSVGSHTITYNCHFVTVDGIVPGSETVGQHSFEVIKGCDLHLPLGFNAAGQASANQNSGLEELVRYILLSNDQFNNVLCDDGEIYKTKESIFRRHDVDPSDGLLRLNELQAMLVEQSVSRYILKVWNDQFRAAHDTDLAVSIVDVMEIPVRPVKCSGASSNSFSIDSITYPTLDWQTESRCVSSLNGLTTAWSYSPKPKNGDYVCAYVDGVLFNQMHVADGTVDDIADVRFEEYEVGGTTLQLPISFTDVRPATSDFLDEHASLVAAFTFDEDPLHDGSLVSVAPTVDGQSSVPMRLQPKSVRTISGCTGGSGFRCLQAVDDPGTTDYSYSLDAEDTLGQDIAMSTWVRIDRSRCSQPKSSNDESLMTVAQFQGQLGLHDHRLRVYLKIRTSDNMVELRASHQVKESVDPPSAFTSSKDVQLDFACDGEWHLIAFAVNSVNFMTLYVDPTSDARATVIDDTTYKRDETWPLSSLESMTDVRMLGAVDFEFDDVRVYTGVIREVMFIDTVRCGHHKRCVLRQSAAPKARRIVCLSGVISDALEETYSKFECGGGLYYDGSTIDVNGKLEPIGVTFSFRDTAWNEVGFEILRQSMQDSLSDAPYESVVMIDSGLTYCHRSYAPLLFADREAAAIPGQIWKYKVVTKTSSGGSINSAPFKFITPWHGEIGGYVYAGDSAVPVPDVRICANFHDPIVIDGEVANYRGSKPPDADEHENSTITLRPGDDVESSSSNVALFKHAYSNPLSEKAYTLTDGNHIPSGESVAVPTGGYARIDLGLWMSIDSVQVCLQPQSIKARKLAEGSLTDRLEHTGDTSDDPDVIVDPPRYENDVIRLVRADEKLWANNDD